MANSYGTQPGFQVKPSQLAGGTTLSQATYIIPRNIPGKKKVGALKDRQQGRST
jgi:hypothetical protein